VPCAAGDFAVVHIAVLSSMADTPGDDEWQPAYRDHDDRGTRTAQIPFRSEHAGGTVWLRVDGVASRFGSLRG
jgi:hypothetical protein